jgi:hypothetical protein
MADAWDQFPDAPTSAAPDTSGNDPWAQFADAKPRFGTGRSFDVTESGLVPSGSAAAHEAVTPDGGAARHIALISRAAAEGVINTLALPLDMKEQLIGPIRNAIGKQLGLPDMPDMTISSLTRKGLDAAGAYNPETPVEHMETAVTRGTTAALTGGALANAAPLAMSQIPNLVRTGVAGASGAGASEIARQQGYGQGVQLIAGLAGGFAPMAVEETLRGVGRAASNIVAPLTRSGQERIAGNVMANQARDPIGAIENLQNADEIVPGSARNTGEASKDIGLMALEKGVRGRSPAPFGERVSEQNVARQKALGDLAGTPADIAAMQNTRNAETGAMREAALGNPVGGTIGAPVNIVADKIDAILASPIGNRDIPSAALKWVRDKLDGETDPSQLYAIRQDIGDAMAGKLGGDAAKFRLARKELLDVRSSLDDAIEFAAPGFKAYLQRYAEMSKPIDQAKIIQEIQRRAQLTSADVTTGQQFLGTSNFTRALDVALQKKGGQLSEQQLENLNAIRTDLQYGQTLNSALIKAPGSDTFQNLSIAQAIGAGGKNLPGFVKVLTKPVDWLYKLGGSDEGVNEALTRAMLDPKLAAQMLQRATPQRMAQFSERLKAAGVGATAGSVAEQSGNAL